MKSDKVGCSDFSGISWPLLVETTLLDNISNGMK